MPNCLRSGIAPNSSAAREHRIEENTRSMTLAARKKIAVAQKKRWMAVKSKKVEPEKPKRKMSAAARKRIGDAARKRWALLKAKPLCEVYAGT